MAGGVALAIAYGPEARAFLQSGLAERLAEEGEVTVVTANPASRAFADAPFPVLGLPCEDEGAAMRRLRGWSRGVRGRLPRAAGLAAGLERMAGRVAGGGAWPRFLRERRFEAVVAASAVGRRTAPALQAAANLGLPTIVLLNSWRDSADSPVRRTVIAAGAGALHQAAVRRAAALPRREFCEALGLDPRRPFALYATAANDAEEPMRLGLVIEALARREGAPQLLVRTNPMDDRQDRYDQLAGRPGVALLRPCWEWDRARDWNCPLPEDLPWWRGALEHCAAALSLPSTLALDVAAWGKPSIPLVWGRGAALWAAPSYAAIRCLPGVEGADSPAGAADLAVRLSLLPPADTPAHADPVEAAAALIRRALTGTSRARRASWAPAREARP